MEDQIKIYAQELLSSYESGGSVLDEVEVKFIKTQLVKYGLGLKPTIPQQDYIKRLYVKYSWKG